MVRFLYDDNIIQRLTDMNCVLETTVLTQVIVYVKSIASFVEKIFVLIAELLPIFETAIYLQSFQNLTASKLLSSEDLYFPTCKFT